MVVFVSLHYCVTKLNGDIDTEKLWCHYIFHPGRFLQRLNHMPVPFIPVKLETLLVFS